LAPSFSFHPRPRVRDADLGIKTPRGRYGSMLDDRFRYKYNQTERTRE
jgi:hypothetical protein